MTFGSPGGGGPGGPEWAPFGSPPREPPKSRNVKKPLPPATKQPSSTYGYILKRAPRRGRAGAPSGAKSRLPLFAISADFRDFHDFMRFPVVSRNFHVFAVSGRKRSLLRAGLEKPSKT